MTIIAVEIRKWKRNKIVWCILVLTLMFGVFAIERACSIARSSPYMDSFGDLYTLAFKNLSSLFLPIVLGMFATTLFFDEQKNDTLKELLIIPITKAQLYFSKVAVVILMSLPIGATLLYLVPVVIAPAYLAGIHPLASVMGIYIHISEASSDMVESLMQGVLPDTSPLVCAGSLLLIGATFATASVVALKKQSY